MRMVKKIDLTQRRKGFDTPVIEKPKEFDPNTIDEDIARAVEAQQKLDEQHELERRASELDGLRKEKGRLVALAQAEKEHAQVVKNEKRELLELANVVFPNLRERYPDLQRGLDNFLSEFENAQLRLFSSYTRLARSRWRVFYIGVGGEQAYNDPNLPDLAQPQPDCVSEFLRLIDGDVSKLQVPAIDKESSLSDLVREKCKSMLFRTAQDLQRIASIL